MRNKEPESMEEIHNIREKLHSETKGLNIHEKMMFIRRKSESFKSKYNLTVKPYKTKSELIGKR